MWFNLKCFVSSKPFSYAIATQELGQGTVDKYVSHEPSGRNFDEIVLDPNGEF